MLGGISPIDPAFIERMQKLGVVDAVDVWPCMAFRSIGTTGPFTNGLPRLNEIRAVTDKPLWVSEVGVSSFGAEEVQEFGLQKTADLLLAELDHVYWYSLFDLPRAWPATTRHREAEGSSYYRHFYMGLYREDGLAQTRRPAFSSVYTRKWVSASGSTSKTTGWRRA